MSSARRERLSTSVRRRGYLLLLAPAVAAYLTFMVYPFISSVGFSLYDWNGIGPPRNFVGLDNYVRLFDSPIFASQFLRALGHNLQFFAWSVALTIVPGFLVAYLLSTVSERSALIYQVLYFIPFVIPTAVVGFMAAVYLTPQFGIVSAALRQVGLQSLDQPFLGSELLALPTVAVIGAWASLGFVCIVFTSTIVAIPRDLIESARVEGASGLQTVRYVVFPLVRPTLIVILTLDVVYSFRAFDLVFVLEGVEAGPNRSTDVIGLLFYRMVFMQGSFGMATALAVISLILVIGVAAVLVRLQKRYTVEF